MIELGHQEIGYERELAVLVLRRVGVDHRLPTTLAKEDEASTGA